MSDFNPIFAYSAGLVGCRANPRADEELVDSIIRHGGDPDGATVAHDWDFADAGRGKLTLLFPAVERALGPVFPGPAQVTGDCFPAGTQVLMADGTTRPIESVVVGDVVVSHTGAKRVVEETIKKPYSGDLLTVSLAGCGKAFSCTPDHRIFAGGDGEEFWCRADLLTEGTEVLVPRYAPDAKKHVFDLQDSPRAISHEEPGRNVGPSSPQKARWLGMKHEVNRFVELDARLAWLVGLYLAEGSMDVGRHGPVRITFNLGRHEAFLAETAAAFMQDIFGVKPSITTVPSKPSVVYLRVTSPPIARLFSMLAPGNTYTKRVAPEIKTSPASVRVAALRGWFAGDGHFKSRRVAKNRWDGHDSVLAVGVSVSKPLAGDMFDLANSCGVYAAMTLRKAWKRSREACNVTLYGENAFAAFPGESTAHVVKAGAARRAGRLGMWKAVRSVERSAFAGDVYCLQVADDHSFVANGVAVHNCVARACAFAYITSLGLEIDSGKPDEVTGRIEGPPEVPPAGVKTGVINPISIWAWRGYDRDGWVCSEAAKVATEKGVLLAKPYPELQIDLTTYGDHNIGIGGARPPGEKWLEISTQNIARTATMLKGREQVRDFLSAGFGVFNCSALGFERTRSEDGVSRQTTTWHHAQSWLGYDDRPETHQKYGQALVLWNNGSWGKWNSGPRRIRGTDIDIPEGTFWALASTIDRCQCIALSSVAGWPRRKHTTFGAKGNI